MFEESRERYAESGERIATDRTAAVESSVVRSTPFRLARLLYGGVLAFMALDDLRNREGRIEYAKAKDAPKPERTVPAASGTLLSGALGILFWRRPRASAAGVASFFLSVTPVMHDFWTQEGEERTQQQIHFLKNVTMLGAALAFLGVADRSE